METLQFSAPAVPDFRDPSGMRREVFASMGTTVAVLLPSEGADVGVPVVREIFARWDATFSRFLPDSELSRVNGREETPTVVSELFFTVLATALGAARATAGTFDPTLLGQMVAAGYDRTFTEIDETRPASLPPAGPGGSWRRIRTDYVARSVTLPQGAGLDFGGIAKEMAVDEAVAALVRKGVTACAVDAGGDLAVHGVPLTLGAWPVAVETAGGYEVVDLHRGALATSSVLRRRWRQGDVERHHLIDSWSGKPATSDLLSATVTAATCAQAGVAAKTALIRGLEHGADFLEEHDLAGMLTDADGRVYRVGTWRAPAAEEYG